MTQITLTSDQTAQLTAATEPVVITDSNGKVVAHVPFVPSADELSPESEAEIIAECKRRLANPGPTRPFSEVIAELKRQFPVDGNAAP